MLLHFDGLDVRWEKNVNYIGQDGNHSHEDMVIFRQHLSRVRNLTPCTDFTLVGVDAIADNFAISHGEQSDVIETTYKTLQKKLIDHFARKYSKNEVQWLKKKSKK